MSNKKTGNEIAEYKPSQFAMIAVDDTVDMLASMITESGISASNLLRVGVPTGGGQFFEVPGLGGSEPAKEVVCIVANVVGKQKTWWRVPFEDNPNGGPPDCSSSDGMHGFGFNSLEEPEIGAVPEKIACETCQWNAFGSKRGKGNGKDCRNFSWLFFILPGSKLPYVMQVPPTSLRALNEYMVMLMTEGRTWSECVTRITLGIAGGGQVPEHSVLRFQHVEDLQPEEKERMKKVSAAVRQIPLPSVH